MAVVSDIEIRLRADIARLQQDMNAARRSVDGAMGGISEAANRAKVALGSIAAGIGLGQLARLTDEYAKFTAQLKLASNSQREYSAAYADVKRIAADSMQGLQQTGVLYARIANGTRELGATQKQVAAITETVNLALMVSGATAEEAASAQLQLSQAFSAGALRGEEFNAVNEAAPRLMLALADGIGVPVGALKKMAEEGKITSQIMADTLPNALVRLREEAKQVQTIAGGFTVLKNNIMEFVGQQAQANGIVMLTTTALRALGENLTLVAGAVLTLTAVKLGTWLAGMVKDTVSAIAANRALAASNLATAQAASTAATAEAALTAARLAEVRAAAVAAAGQVQLAVAINGVIPAQTRAAAAEAARVSALSALTVAQRAASTSATVLSGTLAVLGGPLGAVITVVGLAVTAWSVWGDKVKSESDKAAAAVDESTVEMISRLDKQIEKLRERNRLQSEEPRVRSIRDLSDADASGLSRAKKAMDDATNGTGDFRNRSVMDRQLALTELTYQYETALLRVTQAQDEAAAAAGRTRDSKLADWYAQNGNNAQKLSAELDKLRKEFGTIPPEMEKLVRAKYADKGAEKAIKAEAEAYRNLTSSIRERVADSAREVAGLKPLNEAQKMAADIAEQVASGKLKLSKVERENVRNMLDSFEANLKSIESQKAYKSMVDDLANSEKKLADARAATIAKAQDEAAANEEALATFGMTKTQIEALTLARMEEQLAQRSSLGLTLDEIETLEKLIDAKRRSSAAIAKVEDMQKQKDLWNDIEKTARDTFISIADGGKNAAQRLKDTFKNVFFDWLYQQTLKKWIINISGSASLSTAGGLASAASAGGSAAGLSGSIGSAAGIAGLIGSAGAIGTGALQTAGALLAGNIGLGSTISAGVSALASGTAAGVSAGLSSLAGTLGPIALGIAGAVTLISKAFGRGPKETTATGITGTFGADSFMGSSFTEWIKKGGWFRSDKKGTDTAALSAEQATALNAAYKTIKDSTAQFAAALGIPADVVAGYSKTIKLALTGDETKDQAALAQLFADVGDELAARVLPNIAALTREGETAAIALQRLTGEFQAVDLVLAALGVSSQDAFGAVGVASLAARDRLVQLAGGIEAMASQVDFFNANFLTEAERLAPVQKQVAEQMAALGMTSVTTVEQFKAAVMGLATSGALATEQGSQTYTALLALAPAFKTVADAAAATTAAVEQAAADLAQTTVNLLRTAADNAFQALQRSVDSQKESLQSSFTKLMDSVGKSIDSQKEKVSQLQTLSNALGGTRVGGVAEMQSSASRAAAQAQIAATLAIARSTGYLPDADTLKDALQSVQQDASDQFSSFVDYQRDMLLTQNSIEELASITDTELSVAQTTLKVLQDQKTLAQKQYDEEVARFDMMLASAQLQLDAVNGVRTDIVSLSQAFTQFAGSISSALANQAIAAQASVGPVNQIEALYNSILGRSADASGMQFYQNQLAMGVPLDHIRDQFMNSPEYKAQQHVYAGQQSGTMAGGALSASIDNLSSRMAGMETAMNQTANNTGKFASQFENVSGGGNELAVRTF